MSKIMRLKDCAFYVSQKISSEILDINTYVSTENILQNRLGKTIASFKPKNNIKVTHFKQKDILIANIRPYLKKIWFANHEGGCSADVLVLRANSNVDSSFLYYSLFRDDFFSYIMKGAKGTRMPRGDKEQILNFNIPNMKYQNQKEIGELLFLLDKKIELNNRINAELEAMAKTLYDYWFVQFDFPNEEGKSYKSSGGKMVYNTTLKREIPEGWRDGIIEEVLDKVPHTIKVLNKNILRSGKYPVVDQGQEYICGFTDTKESVLEVKDAHIIFGDHTTIVKLVNFDYSRGADGTQILISKEERIPNYLLYQMVNNLNLTRYGYARHFKFLKEAKIILPMINISNKYNEIVIPIYEKWRHNFFENINLSELRDWLLPMLMNGQVTIK
ncbi:type I restriction endonuclease subunit S [Gilliamella sp. Nev5-1]|uniref:restriction endonuclease subunit S n=1 Tax=Gilliamella sp. Nev5-1 TaxID=3120251 RepID=UPI000828D38B|nr:restriction endonuclease subunit S [Gilliamella apicola]OCG69527.1 type I restriction endonuclease subunit S [Gilliamella apicola]